MLNRAPAPPAIVGLFLAARALFADRAKGRRRCPRCWYALGLASVARCPECGHLPGSERSLLRTRRHWRTALRAGALLLPLATLFTARDGRDVFYAVMPTWTVSQVERRGETVVTVYSRFDPRNAGQRAVVRHGGRTLLDIEDRHIEIGQTFETADPPRGLFEDLDGDGEPELAVIAFSGGAHCCYTVYILDLGKSARVVAAVAAANGMFIESPDRSGEALFAIPDQSFQYWNTSFATSVFPNVYYRLREGSLRVALEKMTPATTDPALLAVSADMVRQTMLDADAPLNTELWRIMLDLLYGGEEAAAWAFFEAAWPESRPGKQAFKEDFLKVLDASPWWKDLVAARQAEAAHRPPPPSLVGLSAGIPPPPPGR